MTADPFSGPQVAVSPTVSPEERARIRAAVSMTPEEEEAWRAGEAQRTRELADAAARRTQTGETTDDEQGTTLRPEPRPAVVVDVTATCVTNGCPEVGAHKRFTLAMSPDEPVLCGECHAPCKTTRKAPKA